MLKANLLTKENAALQFIPDEALDSDTEYTVTVKLGKIYTNIDRRIQELHVSIQNYKTQFQYCHQ